MTPHARHIPTLQRPPLTDPLVLKYRAPLLDYKDGRPERSRTGKLQASRINEAD